MKAIDVAFEKPLHTLIYGTLVILALGLLTSTTILALSHIFMIFPVLYFLNKGNYKSYPKSAWALLAMTVVIVLSVLVNQDIAVKGYAALSKSKYFFFGFLSIAPLSWFFKNHSTDKKISRLLYIFCIATTFATLVGIFSRYWSFNPVTWRKISPVRNAGLFGMVMNYAHNLSFYLVILTGLVISKDKIKKFIRLDFLYVVLGINLIGFYLTYTRGAWLGFLVAVPFFLFKKHKKYFAILTIALLLGGGVFYKLAGEAVLRPESEIQRISQWQAAWAAFKERPVFGYGYLNFEQHSAEIKIKYDLQAKDFGGHAHSNLFEMLGATGILGFLAFIAWVIFWFKEMHDRYDVVAFITLPCIVAFFVGGLTQSTISLGINLFFVMAIYAISVENKKLVV